MQACVVKDSGGAKLRSSCSTDWMFSGAALLRAVFLFAMRASGVLVARSIAESQCLGSSGADLGEEAVDERLRLSRVPAAEEVGVVQHVVEVVELAAQRRARGQRRRALVGAIEGWAEATEETGHGEIGLAVAVIDRGIEQHRFPGSAREPVSAPQIAVQERGARPVTGEQRRQSFEQPRSARAEPPWNPASLAEHQLRAQPPLAEELN